MSSGLWSVWLGAAGLWVAACAWGAQGDLPDALGPRPAGLTPPDAWEPRPPAASPRRRWIAKPVPPAITLHASTAQCHGKGLRYEKSHDRDNIGFWSDPKGFVTWDFAVPIADTFTVLLTVACPPGNAGGEYAVVVRPRSEGAAEEGAVVGELTATVPDTGNWGAFVTEELGTMTFPRAGDYTVAVECRKLAHGALMNLQAVTFRSTRWDRTLVAWWRFEEDSGAETVNAADGRRDAAQFGRWVRGAMGGGLRFNGCSTVVRRPAGRLPRLRDALTIEAWARPASPQEGWAPIASCLRYPCGFFFGLDGAGRLGLHAGVGRTWHMAVADRPLPTGRWSHVAATFEADRGLTVYCNGEEVARVAARGALRPAEGQDLLLGRHSQQPWAWHGVLDEVKLYRRALGPLEVSDHAEWGRAQLQPPPLIALHAVRPDRSRLRVFERVTLDVDLDATYDNPFDPADVRVDARVVSPSGRMWTVPGFLYQPYTRRLEKDAEVLEPAGEPRWQVRLAFPEPGRHWVEVTATDRTGTAAAPPVTLLAEPADAPGRVRRHPFDHRYFVTDRGETFFPIGANVCWAGKRGTYDYDEWLAAYARHGCNFFRVWLSPQWPTLALNTTASGFDAIDQARAWRLDHVLQTAERLGLRVMFCIDSFNIIRAKARSPGNWEDAPYIRTNGGPLDQPHEYFTDPWCLRAYLARLRTLVARWGYSPNLFAWELWNEVDCMDDYDPHAHTVRAWHAAMASTLQRLDPWDHLVATSYARTEGEPAVELLPELDFVMSHSYEAQDMALELGQHRRQKTAACLRPHFHGEFGIFGNGQKTSDTDPTGIHLRNALFASVGQGQAGTPMTWWWDLYVHPRDLYPIYQSFARWIEGFDFVAQRARPMDARFVHGSVRPVEPNGLPLARGTWDPAPFNQPLTIQVGREGVAAYTALPSDTLQGLGFHKALHNPVTFELDAPQDTTFTVNVAKTSGHGEGLLRIFLDGQPVLEQRMPVPEGNTQDTLFEHAGAYAIDVPAGRHSVRVENAGKDWIALASYHIPWLRGVRREATPLRVLGLTGESRALAWVQNPAVAWPAAAKKGFRPEPVAGARVRIAGLTPGRWLVEHYDTHAGEVTEAEEHTVGPDGALVVPLPTIAWDAALRLRRLEDGILTRDVDLTE